MSADRNPFFKLTFVYTRGLIKNGFTNFNPDNQSRDRSQQLIYLEDLENGFGSAGGCLAIALYGFLELPLLPFEIGADTINYLHRRLTDKAKNN